MADQEGSQHDIRCVDLVLEGGGVKGIALVGALEVLEEHGFTFRRVAGSSAGAIAGALIAAGIPAKKLAQILREVDYRRFQDGGPFSNILFAKASSVWLHNGIYRGDYLRTWLDQQLREHGRAGWTGAFADVPYQDPDPDRALPAQRQYRLVVTGSDLTNGRLRYFPWDFPSYGRDPGTEQIVDAVRASMSIPFFYRPVRWREKDGTKTWLVDGGMLSNYPIDVFDAPAGVRPRWPTIGIKLSGKPQAGLGVTNKIDGPLGLGFAMLRTMMGFYDRLHIDASDAIDRTIFVDTGKVRTTDFSLSPEDRDLLYQNGRKAATEFLEGTKILESTAPVDDRKIREAWDFDTYIEKHRTLN